MVSHFPHLLDPRIHPDADRRCVRVPTWDTFEHTTQFITLRDLTQTAWLEDLARYTEEFKLGRIVWPLINLLHCDHLAQVLEEIRRRGLYLFDLWSYVPGSPLEGPWSNVTPPPGMVRHLQRTLGDRFLGIAITASRTGATSGPPPSSSARARSRGSRSTSAFSATFSSSATSWVTT